MNISVQAAVLSAPLAKEGQSWRRRRGTMQRDGEGCYGQPWELFGRSWHVSKGVLTLAWDLAEPSVLFSLLHEPHFTFKNKLKLSAHFKSPEILTSSPSLSVPLSLPSVCLLSTVGFQKSPTGIVSPDPSSQTGRQQVQISAEFTEENYAVLHIMLN